MRTLSGTTSTNQDLLNRKPATQVIARDMMLRWKSLTVASECTDFPGVTSEEAGNNIPWCPIDGEYAAGRIRRVWYSEVSSCLLLVTIGSDPTLASSWATPTAVTSLVGSPDKSHRMSAQDTRLFWGDSGDVKYATFQSSSPFISSEATFRASVYTVDSWHVALAAVSTTVVYVVKLNVFGDFKYLSLHRVTSAGVTDCPHTIVVDDDYNNSSLTWFDAVTLGSKDVVIINEKAHGHPVVVCYEAGVWTQPRPMLPQDIVDNYTFLRIGHATVIADQNSEDVVWATGRRGFGGSTGSHAQEYDVVLRSKDGIHWSSDRYSYTCEEYSRGKLIVVGSNVYYSGAETTGPGDTVYTCKQPLGMNNDHASLKLTLTDDIHSWTYDQPAPGTACKGTLEIAEEDGNYGATGFDTTDMRWETGGGTLAIHPGMWLWRYAGYPSADSLLSTEIVDKVDPSYKAGDRTLSVVTRDTAMRLMRDWRASQDWQWLSQQKHYDDCDKFDGLYSIGGAMITVADSLDGAVAGEVEQEEVTEEDDPNTGLTFQKYNEPGIFLTTKPFDARNFDVRVRYAFSNENPTDEPFGLGNSLVLDTGTGTVDATSLTDSGQNFTDWNELQLDAAYYEMVYMATVVFTDGSIAWGYLGNIKTANTAIYVYTEQCNDHDVTKRGWNGSSVSGKTVQAYYVSFLPEHNRIGYGAGVVGCVEDKNDLVAAFYDMVGDQLMILVRREHTNAADEKIGVWLLAAKTAVGYDPSRDEKYEVRMWRNGCNIQAELVRWYLSSGVPTRDTTTYTASYNWGNEDRMVPGDDGSDRCKVGIIANLQVAETKVQAIRSKDKYIVRWLGHWPESNGYASETQIGSYVDMRSCLPWYSYSYFVEGTSLWLGDEEMTIQQVTQSNLRSTYFFLYNKVIYFDRENLERVLVGRQSGILQDWATWEDDGDEFAHLLYFLDGPGTKSVGLIQSYTNNQPSFEFRCDAGETGDNPTMDQEDYENVKDDGRCVAFSYFMPLPGFQVSRDFDSSKEYPHKTVARSHYGDVIYVQDIWAYDEEYDKTLEWVLKDIASKAGVLDFDLGLSVNETGITLPDGGTNPAEWLQDIDSADLFQRDFDLTITLANVPNTDDRVHLLVRASSKLASAPINGNLTDFSGLTLIYGKNASGDVIATLVQTGTEGTNEDDWVVIDRVVLDDSVVGKRIRWVGRGCFFTLYVNGAWAATLCSAPIFHVDEDGYTEPTAGYVGIYRRGTGGATWTNTAITQPELFTWTDGKILDQRMTAADGLQRVIGDRRIKFQGNANGSLKISAFTSRDDLGTIGDLLYDDTAGPTDMIATHVRVTGEEISEYVDHTNAALYGLTFMVAQASELAEAEAYLEAQRIVEDAVSQAAGRRITAAAQLDWEPEDKIALSYTPADGGAAVSEDMIVESVHFHGRIADFAMNAVLRSQ